MTDWFRTPDWDDQAQHDFESRLARARASSRAQYLRIKAVSLEDGCHRDGAIALLRCIVRDHPDELTEVAFAHERIGDLLRADGDLAGATIEYRSALTSSENLSGTTGEVHLKLGEVLLEADSGAVAEVEELLVAAGQHVTFDSTAFRFNVLAARVATIAGDDARRRRCAAAALALVDAPPQVSEHPSVGRVDASSALLGELEAMASA